MRNSIILVLFTLLYNVPLLSQLYSYYSITGTYFLDEQPQTSLNICINNEWYFTNCTISQSTSSSFGNNCDSILNISGKYHITDSTLILLHRNENLLLTLKIIDTLNIMVLNSLWGLSLNSYLNRVLDYYPGYSCEAYISNLDYFKWEIAEDKLYKYKETGSYFMRREIEVVELPNGYFKRNY